MIKFYNFLRAICSKGTFHKQPWKVLNLSLQILSPLKEKWDLTHLTDSPTDKSVTNYHSYPYHCATSGEAYMFLSQPRKRFTKRCGDKRQRCPEELLHSVRTKYR